MGHTGAYASVVEDEVESRRRAVVDLSWTWLRQVHGERVVMVSGPGVAAGEVADASVASGPGCALAILTADCVPVGLASPEGIIGAAHAGWRGMAKGVIDRTIEAMRSLGATEVKAVIGPCVHAECYEFGDRDLDVVAASVGEEVRARTAEGRTALDLVAGARVRLAAAGLNDDDVADVGVCTACSDEHWSWRARREPARQAMVVWR